MKINENLHKGNGSGLDINSFLNFAWVGLALIACFFVLNLLWILACGSIRGGTE